VCRKFTLLLFGRNSAAFRKVLRLRHGAYGVRIERRMPNLAPFINRNVIAAFTINLMPLAGDPPPMNWSAL